MNERERLLKLIETEGMTAKQFADEIGVGPGTISNIAGGRNNPSLEVIQKVLHRFRHISSQWLVLGTGTMYNTSPGNNEPDLFSANPGDVVEAISNAMSSSKEQASSSSAATPAETIVKEVPVSKTIQKIVIFYSDGTFEER